MFIVALTGLNSQRNSSHFFPIDNLEAHGGFNQCPSLFVSVNVYPLFLGGRLLGWFTIGFTKYPATITIPIAILKVVAPRIKRPNDVIDHKAVMLNIPTSYYITL